MKKAAALIVMLIIIIVCAAIFINKYWNKTSNGVNNDKRDSQEAKDDYGKSNSKQSSLKIDEKLIDGKWKLVWNDEFELNKIDSSKWNIINRRDNYNNELQFYTQNNVIQKNGVLSLIGKKEYKEGKKYTSGLVDTRNKFSLKYGRIDIKAKNPEGKGVFPAIWMLPTNPSEEYPEIDIMEMIGQEPNNIYGVLHYQDKGQYRRSYNTIKLENSSGYHIFSFQWDEASLRWYVDGREFHSTKFGVPHENMYLILNMAIGGNWPGSPDEKTKFPSSFIIDYIRVYKLYKN